jgi:hypothetical protein
MEDMEVCGHKGEPRMYRNHPGMIFKPSWKKWKKTMPEMQACFLSLLKVGKDFWYQM